MCSKTPKATKMTVTIMSQIFYIRSSTIRKTVQTCKKIRTIIQISIIDAATKATCETVLLISCVKMRLVMLTKTLMSTIKSSTLSVSERTRVDTTTGSGSSVTIRLVRDDPP